MLSSDFRSMPSAAAAASVESVFIISSYTRILYSVLYNCNNNNTSAMFVIIRLILSPSSPPLTDASPLVVRSHHRSRGWRATLLEIAPPSHLHQTLRVRHETTRMEAPRARSAFLRPHERA